MLPAACERAALRLYRENRIPHHRVTEVTEFSLSKRTLRILCGSVVKLRRKEVQDGWTLRTADGRPLAQYEHTIVVTHDRPIVLTA